MNFWIPLLLLLYCASQLTRIILFQENCVIPEQFLYLLKKDTDVIVFHRPSRLYGHRYCAYVHGCPISTYSSNQIDLPDHCEVIKQE
jgi:hypothetical protein